jgi:hypothetical protein
MDGIPIGDSLWRQISGPKARLSEDNTIVYDSYSPEWGGRGHRNVCFFCSTSKLYFKDYCYECYRDFVDIPR